MANLEMILVQYKQMNRESDYLKSLSSKMGLLEQELAANWQGSETRGLYAKINDIAYDLNKLSQELNDFSHDYLKSSEQ